MTLTHDMSSELIVLCGGTLQVLTGILLLSWRSTLSLCTGL